MIGNDLLADNVLWIVDIGASGGIDLRWKKFTTNCNAVLFEPDPDRFEVLKTIKMMTDTLDNQLSTIISST